MRSRALVNVVLLAVAVTLAALIAFAPGDEDGPALQPLTDANPRAVSRVMLETEAGEPIVLRRSEGTWDLVDPLVIAANDLRVNSLLGVLGAPVHLRIDADRDALGHFGLATPRARLLLDSKEILFGDTEPIHGRRYLLYDGRVALVDDAYFSHLASSAANYVLPAPLGREPRPRSIRLPHFRVYRDVDGWRVGPEDAPLTADGIERIVNAWRSAQATAVRRLEPDLPWSGEIVVDSDDDRLRFDIARTEYEIILGRRDLGIQYHLTKSVGSRLLGALPSD